MVFVVGIGWTLGRDEFRFVPPLNQSQFVPAEAGTQGPKSAFTRVFNALCTQALPNLGPRFRGDERN